MVQKKPRHEAPSDNLSGDLIYRDRDDGSLEFVGDFEELYRIDANPWGQSGEDSVFKDYYEYSRSNLVECISRLPRRDRVLEAGCGLGYVTNMLARKSGAACVEGADISAEAISKARKLFPHLGFHVADMQARDCGLKGHYDVVIYDQLIWYVLENFEQAIENALSLLDDGDFFVISNTYFPDQKYGKDIVDGFDGLIRFILEHFFGRLVVLEAHYDASDRFIRHDGLLVLGVVKPK